MRKGFETSESLGPVMVCALLALLISAEASAAAVVAGNPPSPAPTQAGDTDPVAGNAAGTPPLPPPVARPKRDLANEQIQELYRQALRSWALAQEDRACEQLMAVETAVVDDREAASRKRLLRAEEAVIHTVAADDLEVLVPIARLHFEVSKRYLAHGARGFALVLAHSRGMVHDLAILYQEQTGTPSAAQVASSILTSLGELMQSAAQHASAAELFDKAAALDPKNAVASLGLSMVYEKHEQYKSAVNTLRRLLQANPDNLEGRLRLAINLRRIDRRDEARKLLEGLLAIDPASFVKAARQPLAPPPPVNAAVSPPPVNAAAPPALPTPVSSAPSASSVDALFTMTASAGSAEPDTPAPAPAPAPANTAAAPGPGGPGTPDAASPAAPAPAAPAQQALSAPAPANATSAGARLEATEAAATAAALAWVQRLAAEELAQLDDAAGSHAAAVKVLRSALERFPASATLRIELAEVLDHAGDIRGSHVVIEKLLELPAGTDDNCRFLYNSPGPETFARPRMLFVAGAASRLPALANALGIAAHGASGTGGGI
jgi:tetratricopeptide (TPR) repeat protein